MKEQKPKVSIGLPVFNGEKHLRQAISSILNQTFSDFELIISDNASTDNTEKICKEYAARDARIFYYRNKKNIGAPANHNVVFNLSQGHYFHWFSADDILSPLFLEKTIEIMERNPSIILCFSNFIRIDECDQIIDRNNQSLGESDNVRERLHQLASLDHDCELNYGLIRSEILRKTELEQNYDDSDRILLCELALYGRFYIIQEALFSRREHPGRYLTLREIQSVSLFAQWQQFFQLFRVISRSPLSPCKRFNCYLYVCQRILMQNRWEKMIRELLRPIKKKFLKQIKYISFANTLK